MFWVPPPPLAMGVGFSVCCATCMAPAGILLHIRHPSPKIYGILMVHGCRRVDFDRAFRGSTIIDDAAVVWCSRKDHVVCISRYWKHHRIPNSTGLREKKQISIGKRI
jgi:hypothetical protein